MHGHILVVEDEPVQAELLKQCLIDDGATVDIAANGFEAVKRLQEGGVDILLTDYRMPAMSGIELIKESCELGINIPKVILTVVNDMSLVFSALDAGADDYLVKDADCRYLSIVSAVLERANKKHAQAQLEKSHSRQLESIRQLSHITLNAINQGVLILNQSCPTGFCQYRIQTAVGITGNYG